MISQFRHGLTGALPVGWEDNDGKLASAFVRATKPRDATTASYGWEAGRAVLGAF